MESVPQNKAPVSKLLKDKSIVKENKVTPSKVSSVEWIIVVVALALIDLVQFILDLFAIGAVVNRIIDVSVGMGLLIYLWMRGELKDPTTKNRALLTLAATFLVELVPFLDAAPFWVLDGLFFWYQSRKRNERFKTQQSIEKEQVKELTSFEKRVKIMEIQDRKARVEDRKREIIEDENDIIDLN